MGLLDPLEKACDCLDRLLSLHSLRNKSELFLVFRELLPRALQRIIHGGPADAELLRDLRQREILLVIQLQDPALLLRQQASIIIE